MGDALPMSADFPSMGTGWPKHVINCSGAAAGKQTVKAGSGKGEPAERKGKRGSALIRNGDGPKPITVKRMVKENVPEASATLRNVRIMPKAGNSFSGGRNDSQR